MIPREDRGYNKRLFARDSLLNRIYPVHDRMWTDIKAAKAAARAAELATLPSLRSIELEHRAGEVFDLIGNYRFSVPASVPKPEDFVEWAEAQELELLMEGY